MIFFCRNQSKEFYQHFGKTFLIPNIFLISFSVPRKKINLTMIKKSKQGTFSIVSTFWYICTLSIVFLSCSSNSIPINNISDAQKVNSSIMVRNWLLKGPYLDTADNLHELDNQMLNPKLAEEGINYYQNGDYIPLDSVFKANAPSTNSRMGGYLSCIVQSSIEQNVAFLFGMHGDLKLWLNGKLIIVKENDDNISKNRYTVAAHLKKGNNEIWVELFKNANSDISWTFHLDISSINYVRKYAFGDSFFSISEDYLVKEADSLSVRIKYPAFIPATSPVHMQVTNTNNDIVLEKTLPAKHQWKVNLNTFKLGAYKCKLITDADTLEQCFVYGDYKKVFSDYQNRVKPLLSNDVYRINVETLCQRFLYMDDFGARNQYGEWLERKISATIFELGAVLNKLSSKKEAFAGIPGLHIRGFRSTIDRSVDNYMLYVPPGYKSGKKMPVVVMMPYVTKLEPFLESWHVADITRIELIAKLANKHGFCVLLPSSRIYRDYNLNPIISTATFEALAAVKRDYAIDNNKIYLYGDCSGGLQALLIANRFPSFFAAVGVEGPELSYLQSGLYPYEWTQANDIIQTAENYKNIPILIFHTPTDTKAKFAITRELVRAIRKVNAKVILDTLKNATKAYKFKLISEEVIISKVFDFFKNKERISPDTINFSTYQLKYNRSHWITIDDKEDDKKASVYAICSDKNTIKIDVDNINKLTIDLKFISKINRKTPITITCNHKQYNRAYPLNGQIVLDFTLEGKSRLLKTDILEGPINDVFKSGFIVVSGTSGTIEQKQTILAATNTICKNWKKNFFTNCTRKNDTEISDADLLNNNLILIGSAKTNLIIKRFKEQIPLTTTNQYIQINGKRYAGKALCYSFIYPSPVNKKRYFFIIGSNYRELLWQNIKDFPLRGWYDYEVWESNSVIDKGCFNKYWRFPSRIHLPKT